MTALAVAAAGALGALLRHVVGILAGPTSWPWPTFGINVVGSFLLGVVTVWGAARWPGAVTAAAGTGFLGAFTTYSTFSVQTVTLLREGRTAAAGAYVAASLLAGVLAAAAGITLGRALLPGSTTT